MYLVKTKCPVSGSVLHMMRYGVLKDTNIKKITFFRFCLFMYTYLNNSPLIKIPDIH